MKLKFFTGSGPDLDRVKVKVEEEKAQHPAGLKLSTSLVVMRCVLYRCVTTIAKALGILNTAKFSISECQTRSSSNKDRLC